MNEKTQKITAYSGIVLLVVAFILLFINRLASIIVFAVGAAMFIYIMYFVDRKKK